MAEDHSNPELEQKLKTVTDEDALSKMVRTPVLITISKISRCSSGN